MKRGLVLRDETETSADCFESRVARLQSKLAEAGCSFGLIYGDVSRSSDINYLTNFCLYWNEAILVVPVKGRAVLVTKLSKRVHPWIRQTSTIEEMLSGPGMPQIISKYVKERIGPGRSRIGVVDQQWWPATLLSNVQEELRDCELIAFTGLVREERLVASAEELSLLRHAASSLAASFNRLGESAPELNSAVARISRESRLAGFMDIDVTADEMSKGVSSVLAVGQYRYSWLRIGRVFGTKSSRLRDALQAAIHEIRVGTNECQLVMTLTDEFASAGLRHVSCCSHVDLESGGLFRPPNDGERAFREGEVLSPMLSFQGSKGVVSLSETIYLRPKGPEMLSQSNDV